MGASWKMLLPNRAWEQSSSLNWAEVGGMIRLTRKKRPVLFWLNWKQSGKICNFFFIRNRVIFFSPLSLFCAPVLSIRSLPTPSVLFQLIYTFGSFFSFMLLSAESSHNWNFVWTAISRLCSILVPQGSLNLKITTYTAKGGTPVDEGIWTVHLYIHLILMC